jgi:phage protein D
MSAPGFSNVIDVKVNGAPLPKDVLPDVAGARIDLGAGVPGAFEITLGNRDHKVLERSRIDIGDKIQLAPVAHGQGAQDPIITGEVTAVETTYDGRGTFAVVRGYDLGHRLLRNRRVARYEDVFAGTIVRKLAALSAVPIGMVEMSSLRFDFIAQDNITDWDFLTDLADRSEKILYLDHKGLLQFVSPDRAAGAPPLNTPGDKSPYVLQAGEQILRCRAAVTSADQVKRVQARGWDVTNKRALTATAPALSNDGMSIGTTPGQGAAKFAALPPVDAGIPYDDQGQVERAAKALADDVTAAFAEVEVTVHGNPKLRPDIPVTLTDVGKPFEGKYTVTAVRHYFGKNRHYETWVTVSGRQWRSVYGLVSGAGGSSGPRLPSVANAIVTDVHDPLKQGRVKLKFPWLDPDYVSDWARTVQSAGVKGGSMMPLDVNDEVLVAFDRGVLDHPYVIGGLYNGKDKPVAYDVALHDKLKGKATRHTVADRDKNRMDLLSQKTGQRKRGVRLRTGDDRLTIFLDRTKTEITVDSKGTVSIKGSRSVSVEAGTDLTLKAGGNMDIRANGRMSLRAGGVINTTAGAALNLSAGADFMIKSAMGSITTGALTVTAAETAVTAAAFQVESPLITIGTPASMVNLLGAAVLANELPVV